MPIYNAVITAVTQSNHKHFATYLILTEAVTLTNVNLNSLTVSRQKNDNKTVGKVLVVHVHLVIWYY